MKRPSSRTIAAAVGALALSGVAVAAVAASDDTTEPAATEPATTQTDVDQPSEEPSESPSATDSPAPRTSDGVTSEQAVAIAEQALAELSGVPAVREVEREFEHGRDVWEVEFGREHEVDVDAVTGEVIKIEIDDDDDDDRDWDDDDRYDD